ncbi:MAG TPA: hypothetical protein ENF21_11180 [Bacteroidetes bacterium]|nr:hypothetical protein [Bacteroidota bacterium]
MKRLLFGVLLVLIPFYGLFCAPTCFAQQTLFVDTLYVPAGEDPMHGAMYPRVICLQHQPGKGNGTLLATFEHYIRGMRSFPI